MDLGNLVIGAGFGVAVTFLAFAILAAKILLQRINSLEGLVQEFRNHQLAIPPRAPAPHELAAEVGREVAKGETEAVMLSEQEKSKMVYDVQLEAGCDEETARKEVDQLLVEAGMIGSFEYKG